jgi:ribosome maturation factor RimP
LAETLGYEIVRVMMIGAGSGKPTLQVMAERPDGTMLVDDCGRLSQAISAVLDVENTIESAYYLEVSSPGVDRPLTRLKDFDTYKNNEARIETDMPVDGRKRFKGMLRGVKDNAVILETETGAVCAIPFDSIAKAKLSLTDELLKSYQPQKKKQATKK